VGLALIKLIQVALTDEAPAVSEICVHVAHALISGVESNEPVSACKG
jgi:hypothetical protein